ncbi:hypothetical protein [Enterococcus sp. HY326]|uniref:hypothetical protein n=1 Tax=Enterococcus sp. HY326 TaxID=2971265 RepID=UPI00223EDCB7|nr:hypothetical protein [Enterococcus sp. HY326]
MKEFFVGQENFLKDYRKVAKDEDRSDDEIVEGVRRYLDENFTSQYILPAEKSLTKGAYSFPFDKQMYTDELDETLKNRYIYIGETIELETREDEQL